MASLKKVLPMSIQAGELSTEKTRELLAMAQALDNPELVQFVEQTLIEALMQEEVTLPTRQALVESLALIGTAQALEAILSVLESSEPALRECVCMQLMPFAGRSNTPLPKRVLVEAMLGRTDDPQESVRLQAYQFLALCPTEGSLIIPVLLRGAKHPDLNIRRLSLTGL